MLACATSCSSVSAERRGTASEPVAPALGAAIAGARWNEQMQARLVFVETSIHMNPSPLQDRDVSSSRNRLTEALEVYWPLDLTLSVEEVRL